MGMYDDVRCEYPLPDNTANIRDFQTKAFGDGFTGGFMDNYTITADGELVLHKTVYEIVEEKDRPYYGKPEWKNPLLQIAGSMKAVPVGDEIVDFHGFVDIYTNGANNEWIEYKIKFTDGKISDVKRIYREFGK